MNDAMDITLLQEQKAPLLNGCFANKISYPQCMSKPARLYRTYPLLDHRQGSKKFLRVPPQPCRHPAIFQIPLLTFEHRDSHCNL